MIIDNLISQQDRKDPAFVITLWDYASPSFCSFTKEYAGNLQMLDRYFAVRAMEHPDSEETQYFASAFARLRQGEAGIIVNVAYQDVPFGKPAELIAVKKTDMLRFEYRHMNVWDCPYWIHAERCEARLAYIRADDMYLRCVLAEFTSPMYSTVPDERIPLGRMIMGQPSLIALEADRLYNRLMIVESRFDSEKELNSDMKTPCEIDYSGFFDDVFGDG